MKAGQTLTFVIEEAAEPSPLSPEEAESSFEETTDFWRDWISPLHATPDAGARW